MIKLINVNLIKFNKQLFQDFSWTIREGEHWIITGANGSGKTTLLELIAGKQHASTGIIEYDFIEGKSWEQRYWDRQKKIKYIPAHAMQSFLRGNEMYYQQRYYGIGDERTPRVCDYFKDETEKLLTLNIPASLNIQNLLNLEITRLSSGQLKKVLLLQSLLKEIPRLLLLDYPFEGLDQESRKDLCDFIDIIATTYGIQIIIVDQHHELPTVINRKLTLHNFNIAREEDVSHQHNDKSKSTAYPLPSIEVGVPVVEIRNLIIQYGDTVILKDFNWTIHRGERWALTGRNGSGKTTLFSLIFADHPMAYSQEIYLFGKRRGTGESIWNIKNRINYFGPELLTYLNPKSISYSAEEYIRGLHKKIDEHKLTALLEYFKAANFIDKPVRTLSSGQLQSMLIINCFLNDRELILLDEPFQFLDNLNRELLTNYLQFHLGQNQTLILITHYQQDIQDWTQLTMKIQ